MEIKRDKHGRPRVYLEEDCPVAELSVESQRERGASSALPPLYFLHVWWARRPLTVSRAAVLGSLLPAGFDRKEFLEMIGVPRDKDPVAAKVKIDEVKAGIRKERVKDPYGYPRAFTHSLTEKERERLKNTLKEVWGSNKLTVLDSFAGGGSIPFEAVRLGFNAIANELNPVASIIERATIEYPVLFGKELEKDIRRIGEKIEREIEKELTDCFPRNQGEADLCYIWARTVRCDKCELTVPLSPNWWLDTKNGIGFRPVVPVAKNESQCTFRIEKASSIFDPNKGSIKRGIAECPRCSAILDGDYIKREARDSRMNQQLAVIGYKLQGKSGRRFREVEEKDLEGVKTAEKLLKKRLPEWERKGLVPNEKRYLGPADRSANYGILQMRDMFSPRQLLVHLTTIEKILEQPWKEIKDEKKREAIRVYLQLAFDKSIDYDSILNLYHPNRIVIAHVFARHDFAFTWSYGEIDGSGQLFRWSIDQIVDSYLGLSKINNHPSRNEIIFMTSNAASLTNSGINYSSVDAIVTDPPYYDNVMYSECSDFFYVWMKRGLRDIFPDLFEIELTDKDTEAVANVSRFTDVGRGKARDLAKRDYEAKMLASFQEMHRLLKDDGVMTIMFTHKQVEAWDALALALLNSGFEITASWPVHTESEHSLHQSKKNAAASTILLVCRKRPVDLHTSWWEEIQSEIDEVVKKKAEHFASQGLRGQDTFIACFGPALQVISEHWPVKKRDGTVIRPDEALDRARSVVSTWFMERIAEGKAETLDPRTRFYILVWYVFKAREFSFDEARKLGISLNVEADDLIRSKVIEKKGEYIRILKPQERFRARGIRPDAKSFDHTLDYVQAAMYAYQNGKSAELNRFHQRTGALAKEGYKEAISYLLDVLPRTEEVIEYQLLNEMWESNYRDQVRRKPRSTDPSGKLQTKLEIS